VFVENGRARRARKTGGVAGATILGENSASARRPPRPAARERPAAARRPIRVRRKDTRIGRRKKRRSRPLCALTGLPQSLGSAMEGVRELRGARRKNPTEGSMAIEEQKETARGELGVAGEASEEFSAQSTSNKFSFSCAQLVKLEPIAGSLNVNPDRKPEWPPSVVERSPGEWEIELRCDRRHDTSLLDGYLNLIGGDKRLVGNNALNDRVNFYFGMRLGLFVGEPDLVWCDVYLEQNSNGGNNWCVGSRSLSGFESALVVPVQPTPILGPAWAGERKQRAARVFTVRATSNSSCALTARA
jgi:hypothetical protein